MKVTFLPYHVTWSHRLKIAIFKTCSESLNMGRVCSMFGIDASSDPAKFQGD